MQTGKKIRRLWLVQWSNHALRYPLSSLQQTSDDNEDACLSHNRSNPNYAFSHRGLKTAIIHAGCIKHSCLLKYDTNKSENPVYRRPPLSSPRRDGVTHPITSEEIE